MARRFGVLGAVVLVVVALAWAGVVNLRARRKVLDENRVQLIPAGQPSAADAGAGGAPGAQLEGKAAPSFTLTSLDGKKVSLSDYKGHPVIVNFWATWCGPCKLEMPWFEEFSHKYQDKGLVILGLSQDDLQSTPKNEIASAVKRLGVSYPVLLPDSDEGTARKYGGVDYLPETFYVDRSGKVLSVTAGAPSKDQMEGLIQRTIAAE